MDKLAEELLKKSQVFQKYKIKVYGFLQFIYKI